MITFEGIDELALIKATLDTIVLQKIWILSLGKFHHQEIFVAGYIIYINKININV